MRHGATLLLRGFDIANELSDLVAAEISAAADPRARLLRRRRRALRWGLIFTAGCLFWGVVTAVLAAWGWFALLLEITGGIAVVQAIPATLLLIRYRWLRSEPLPAQRLTSSRRLPPPEFGGTIGDVGAGSLRTGLLLAAGRHRAGRHVARHRDSRPDRGGHQELGRHGGHRRRGGIDGAGGQRHSADHGRIWCPPSTRSPRS